VCVGVLAVLVLTVAGAGAATSATLQLRTEGKAAAAGAELEFVAGYSMGECYWEEQEFKVVTNGSRTDKLVRSTQNGLVEGCSGGAKVIEITSAKMTVRMAPLRIHATGGCVYQFKEMSGPFKQREWGPEVVGTATGALYRPESSASCPKTRRTIFDVGLSGVETKVTG
jgi:hypothetical protein